MLFTVMTLVGCLIGYWLLVPARVQPLSWLDEWQGEVLQPLAEAQLTLGQLTSRLPAAELWLQPGSDGPGLLLRDEQALAAGGWRLEAELALDAAQRASLAAASGLQDGDAEQPQAASLLQQLSGHSIGALSLQPLQEVAAEAVSASLGAPRLRLQVAEGEVWVYPQLGLTVHVREGRLQWLRAVPRRLLRH